MELFQQKAWDCLNLNEKTALQLTLSLDKSMMESAVIMNIYPYKFSEILSRAKKFFFMYTNYFELYGDIFYPDVLVSEEVKAFFEDLVLKRYTLQRTLLDARCINFTDISYKKITLEEYFKYLKVNVPHLYEFLLEFDRWNSFRILPKSLQKPSPFKRRQNKIFKKISTNIVSLTELSYNLIIQSFKGNVPPYVYLPLISPYLDAHYTIIPITNSPTNLTWVSNNKLPIFKNKDEAIEFANFVMEYNFSKTKNSYLARKYWPTFKQFINKSVNVYELLGIKDFKSIAEEITLKKQLGKFNKYQ